MSDVPENVDLRWIARALVGLRQDVRDMRRELDGLRSDVRSAREDTNVAIMHTIRIERGQDEIRDNLAELYGRNRGLSERLDQIEGER